jgi:hypothetical protein
VQFAWVLNSEDTDIKRQTLLLLCAIAWNYHKIVVDWFKEHSHAKALNQTTALVLGLLFQFTDCQQCHFEVKVITCGLSKLYLEFD